MNRKLSLIAATLMGVGMLGATPVYASTAYSWTLTSGGCTGQGSYTWGNTCSDNTSFPTGGPALTATAYSNTGSGGDLQTAHAEHYSGGIGISNRQYNGADGNEDLSDSPEHAIDNADFVDSLLLSFTGTDTPIALTSITFGWVGTDADFDLLRYTGGGTPNLTPAGGQTYAELLTNGWSLVGQYANSSAGTVVVNATGLTSSYWLVAADTSLLAGSALTDCTRYKYDGTCKPGYTSVLKDYFKVQSAAGTYTPPPSGGGQVPEPGSLALLGLGTLMLARTRRKKYI